MIMCGIYKIENLINGKIYIGQSIEIERRFKRHLQAKDDYLIHRALRKYGKENFTFQIIEECKPEELNLKEVYWINKFNSLQPFGYNMVEGGASGAGYAKGKIVEQYDLNGKLIKTYSSANQASQQTEIDHWSICACCRGEYSHAGGFQWKYQNDENKIIQKLEVRTNFIVLQLDKNTNEILNEYSSLKEASEKTKIAKSTICNVCNGKGKTAGGFKWKYKE